MTTISHPKDKDVRDSSLPDTTDDSDSDTSDTVDPRPAKHRKVESRSPPPPHHKWAGSFWKNAKLWDSDGDIILVCEGMGFRVHKKTLAHHSEVFRDMLSSATDERYEDCDVVRLSDGSAEFYYLLEALQCKG